MKIVKEEIVYKSLDEIKEYENNPRQNDEAVEYVANSIKEFGFRNPIILDKDNVIIAGHTRYKASQWLKLKEVPCIYASDLTEEQVKAFRIADNKLNEYAKWDEDLLKEELEELENLDELDFALSDLGIDFDDFDLELDGLDLKDELELERTEQTQTQIKKLSFGKYKITLSDEELEMLTILAERYLERTGVLEGFVQDLVGGMFND